MSQSVEIFFDEAEFLEIGEIAARQHVTIAEWVRRSLRNVRSCRPGAVAQKLEAVRAASRHSFPTTGIDQMLAEIEQGYGPSGDE
jgi:hypothetical protein